MVSLFGFFGFLKIKDIKNIVVKTAFIIVAVFLLENVLYALLKYMSSENMVFNDRTIFTVKKYSSSNSGFQRLYSIIEGLKLWTKSPFLGIGLGGFVHHEMIKNGIPLVIHNTFVWILSEFGIVGASVFFWYGFTVLKYLYNLRLSLKAQYWNLQDKLLFNVVIIFILMGSAHEIFYQRIIWFMLGAAIVAYRSGGQKNLSELI